MAVLIAPDLFSNVVAIEVGNTRNFATTDDAIWLALSVKNSSMKSSPGAELTMSTFVKVETGVGGPVLAGINSTTLFVPITTASYISASADDDCVTGTAYNGSARAR